MILNSNIWTLCFDVKSIATGDFCSLSLPVSVEPCHDAWRKRNGNKKSMGNPWKSIEIHENSQKSPKLFQFPSKSFDHQSSVGFRFPWHTVLKPKWYTLATTKFLNLCVAKKRVKCSLGFCGPGGHLSLSAKKKKQWSSYDMLIW